jgi:threonine/homoserine/homoserine lactone efflux protein
MAPDDSVAATSPEGPGRPALPKVGVRTRHYPPEARLNAVIGDILPLALGVAISPIPIIAAILMLFSPRATGTSVGFLVGWILGIIVVTGVFTALSGSLTAGSDASTGVSWTKIILGVLLLLVGLRQWRGRNDAAATPKWMAAINDFTPVKALGLGFLLSAVNPKNLLMGIAAGVAIGSAGLSVGGEAVAIAVFTVIAASTVAVPVIAYLFAKQKMRGPLDALKAWLETNNATVMAVLLLVIGVVLIGKGIGRL